MKKGRLLLLLIFIALAVLLKITSIFYVDFNWYKDLGYSQLYLTPIIAKLQIGSIAFLLYFVIIFLTGFIGYRVFINAENYAYKTNGSFRLRVISKVIDFDGDQVKPPKSKVFYLGLFLISCVISLFFALAATENGWMKLLEFRNASPFEIKDILFNQDISFYVFKMPLYSFLIDSLLFSLSFVFAISVFVYFITGLVQISGLLFRKEGINIPPSIRRFWAFLTACIFILLGLKQYLTIYAVMYSQHGYVYGAGYTDIHVTVPLVKVLTVLAFICSLASMVYFFVNDHRIILRTLAIYLLVAILGGLAQGLIQYNVSNNEFVKEKPYIEQEIKYTQMAYNLSGIQFKDYPGVADLSLKNIENNRSTIDNIRLNDPVPLKTVLAQNQGIRYYYRFNDIDVNRYKVNDKYRQVLLAPREISDEALTDKAGTFVNLTMRYTHGYGVAATLANEIDSSGYARLIIKDIPPQSSMSGIDIKEPRIYFGELTNDSRYGYVIGNSSTKEFDYPLGENNVENSYQGKTGLPVNGLNKFFLSSYLNTFRLYMAGEINENSKILLKRNIEERVQTLMPYLSYDQDPYVVIAKDGKLYWIIDAYTTTNKFPYSAPYGGINYIRNSVKVVIDAYNGNVSFYIFDAKDPILKTIQNIFPGVFQDKQAMPSNLLEHIRYPEDLFQIQSKVLLNFHVNNPSVFYNKEDTWDIAKKVEGANTVALEPYYSIMKLPGEQDSEFTLMLPFTPASRNGNSRNNMVAWLAARNDGEHYGELQLYRMPKNIEIQGPLMIDSLIDQDTVISGKMTLWGQGGSQIIRGNLLVVPIDDGFLYVEPIYIRAEKQGASIPQMQAIVFAIDKKIVMVETNSLDKAMEVFFNKAGLDEPTTPDQPGVVNTKQNILSKINLIRQQLQELEREIQNMQ
ncbi:MAG: UPF0182 family protein [Carboxydocellales bacterium]